jgi:hypothetical protein
MDYGTFVSSDDSSIATGWSPRAAWATGAVCGITIFMIEFYLKRSAIRARVAFFTPRGPLGSRRR